MKKLILSMLIALGGIVSTQAQFTSFNLSCPIEPEHEQVIINLDGYSLDQLATLAGLGFTEGTSQISGQSILVGTISERNLTISHIPAGIFVNGGGVVEGVAIATTYYFRVSGGNGFTNLYAITADGLIGVIQSLDLDGNGLSLEEEMLLATYVDNSNGPLFDMDTVGFTQIESDTYGYIIIEPVGIRYHVYDEDEVIDEYHDTFMAALDAAVVYANE